MDPENLKIERRVTAVAKRNLVTRQQLLEQSGVNSDLCKNCLLKYQDEQGGMHWPKCSLGYDVQVGLDTKSGVLNNLSEDEKNIYKCSKDPVLWSKLMLDYTPRWYQEELLRCSAQKIVVRAGRRIGKTDSLAVKILYLMYTKPFKGESDSYKVLIICPYERQVNLIFDRLRELISKSPLIKDSILRDIHNPQRIEFTNGSICEGVPAGVRTGAKADQVRGKDADFIALDEADFLDEGSIESIMAIFASHKDCLLWASSTITGNRSFFYDWCTNKKLGFKEFRFPASVSPNWTEETELFYRQTYSEAAYKREFDVEFSEADDGVFLNKYIDKSLFDYGYNQCSRVANNLYVMGVDWNSTGKGTHIVVTEYDIRSHRFKLVFKEVVDGAEFTQTLAISRIIDIDFNWNCDYIYVDAGFGSTQIEDIKRYGLKNPSSNLSTKIKPVDFGSKTNIRDPYTGKMIKRHTKPLVVELAARRVESHQCMFPKSETQTGHLIDQMRSFKVKRYGRDGQPVYTDDNDHTLVAWMLSVFGLIYEFSDLTKFTPVTTVRFLQPASAPKSEGNNEVVDTVKKSRSEKERLKPMPRWVDVAKPGMNSTLSSLDHVNNATAAERRRRIHGGRIEPNRWKRKTF